MVATLVVFLKIAPSLFSGIAPLSSIIAVAAAAPLGLLLGYFFFGYPLYLVGKRLNGGPFHEGDWVRILSGPHKNRLVRVYEVWSQRNQIRVDLGEHAKAQFRDVFSILQVYREQSPVGDDHE